MWTDENYTEIAHRAEMAGLPRFVSIPGLGAALNIIWHALSFMGIQAALSWVAAFVFIAFYALVLPNLLGGYPLIIKILTWFFYTMAFVGLYSYVPPLTAMLAFACLMVLNFVVMLEHIQARAEDVRARRYARSDD